MKQPKYSINSDLLQPGDIILTKYKGKMSMLIRLLTFGRYSHAAIYLGAESYAEAAGPGTLVTAKNLQRLLFKNKNECTILRLTDDVPKNKLDDIIIYARSWIGQKYSYEEAKKVVYRRNGYMATEKEQFCSRYVAMAYKSAGFSIVKSAEYCSPGQIYRSKKLTRIKNAIKRLSEEEIEFFSKKSKSIDQMQVVTELVLGNTSEISGTYIADFPTLNKFIIENPEYDEKFYNVFVKSGYLNIWKFEKQKQPERYDYEKLKILIPDINERKLYAKKLVHIINDGLKRYEANKTYFELTYKEHNLRTIEVQLDLYNNLLSDSYMQLTELEKALK